MNFICTTSKSIIVGGGGGGDFCDRHIAATPTYETTTATTDLIVATELKLPRVLPLWLSSAVELCSNMDCWGHNATWSCSVVRH